MRSSAQIIKVGGVQLAFGLQWSTLPGAGKQAHEVRKLVKDNQADYVTVFQKNDHSKTMVGLLRNNKKGMKGKILSAGVLFARGVQSANAMLLYRFPDGLCVFIGILDGLPMPGYDGCGDESHMQHLLAQFIGLRQGVQLQLYGNLELDGMASLNAMSLPELLAAPRKALKEAVLNTTAIPAQLMVGTILLAASLVAAYAGYAQWKKQAKSTRSLAAVAADPNIWYREAMPKMLATAGYPAHRVAQYFLDAMGEMPLFHAGWALSSMKCTAGFCDATWNIMRGGSFSSFKEALLPNLQNVVYQKDLKTISARISFALPKDGKGEQEDKLPNQAAFEFAQDDANQKMMGLYPLVIRKPAQNLLSLPPNISESSLRNVIHVGDWEVRGSLYQASMLKDLPVNMTLESLEATFTPGNFAMLVQGKYYVKK